MRGTPVGSDHHEVNRGVGFKRRLRKQGIHKEITVNARGLRFKHEPHGLVFAAFVSDALQNREHRALCLLLIGCERFFAGFGFGIGDFLDFREHSFGACRRRQFINHKLPLPALQVFKVVARPHAKAPSTRRISCPDFRGRRDDLTAPREVRRRNLFQNVV